ncbi:redoxin family protein [Pedobacter sp. KBS0701]|uniref:TlpA family protein disulfide reductase n=1 Tax=Pedobacter sp. KBS0701 TaxID=2578106 RepID=UPI001AEFF7D4|nr:redoxin family protein [Pedobacter sp. KBS0701]
MADRKYISVIMPKRSVDNVNDFKGIDISGYKIWELYLSSFSDNQSAYELVGMEYLKKLDPTVDTTLIYRGKLEKNGIASFVGLDAEGNFHAVVDANNNRDFSDDHWYRFLPNPSKKEFMISKEEVFCTIGYYDKKQLRDTSVNMDVEFLRFPAGYDGEDEYNQNGRLKKLFEIRMLKKSYKMGTATLDGQEYAFLASDQYYNLYPSAKAYSMTVKKMPLDSTENLYQYFSSSNELVRVGNGLYRIPKTIKDELTLSYVKEAAYGDGSVGNAMPPGTAENLTSGKKYLLGKRTGKFALIDFWASWCGPCIEAMPTLKAFQLKYAAKGVQVLSLAIDKPTNKPKLKHLISEQQMDWPQLYMDAGKEGQAYLKECHIQSFPTTILIDPEGKVLYRGTFETSIHKADELLSRIFSKK